MSAAARFACCVCVPLGVACGPTNAELAEQTRSESAAIRGRAAALATAIDSAAAPAPCTRQPALVYAPDRDSGNTDFIMYEELRRAGRYSVDQRDRFDFSFYKGNFPQYLIWSEPTSSVWIGRNNDRATSAIKRAFTRAPKVTHLVVFRAGKADRNAGTLEIDVRVGTLEPPTVVCGFTVIAGTDPTKGYVQQDIVRKRHEYGSAELLHRDLVDDYGAALLNGARVKAFAAVREQLGLATPD